MLMDVLLGGLKPPKARQAKVHGLMYPGCAKSELSLVCPTEQIDIRHVTLLLIVAFCGGRKSTLTATTVNSVRK